MGSLSGKLVSARKRGLCCALVFGVLAQASFEKAFAQLTSRQYSRDDQTVLNNDSPGLIASHPEASRAWQNFAKQNNHRLASASDFVLSADRYRAYGDGDFNGDNIYNDFAIIVVDNTRTDVKRFALIIFNARKGSQGYDGPYWLYKGVDLSSTSLNLISHGPLVITDNRENEVKACIVRWNRTQRKYRCEVAPISSRKTKPAVNNP